MVGAPLVPVLLERCRAAKPSRNAGAAELLAALSSDCLLPILPDLIDLLPRHGEALAPALARLGVAAVAAVPALLEAERTGALDRQTSAQTVAGIGPAAGRRSSSRSSACASAMPPARLGHIDRSIEPPAETGAGLNGKISRKGTIWSTALDFWVHVNEKHAFSITLGQHSAGGVWP